VNQAKATRTVRVVNRQGVHARAATLIAEVVRRYQSRVSLHKGSESVEGTDVLQIMSLGAAEGEEVMLEAWGDDAETVLDALAALFNGRFGNEDNDAE
jgi:phosphotransferase system HPr (HPr) family protein